MSDEINKEEMKDFAQYLGAKISNIMPEGWGFTLLLFEYGDSGNLVYLSSANPEDMVKAMQEFLERRVRKGLE